MKPRRTKPFVLAIAVCAALLGCGSESKEDASPACKPGSSEACAGPSGCPGYQVCKADGSGFEACDCSGGTGGAGGGAGSDAGASVCPTGLPGPELVEVPAPDGSKYCIDSTEVTLSQYQEFLATNPSEQTEPGRCQWLTPQLDADCMTGVVVVPNTPARCVRWCDASAYCLWAGKRLCGRIGGGPIAPDDVAKAHLAQWYNGCSAGGTLKYAYGDEYILGCGATAEPAPVKTEAKCAGGYPGLYEMSGNVVEWIDACLGQFEGCWTSDPSNGLCATFQKTSELSTMMQIGFRCCHDGIGAADGGG